MEIGYISPCYAKFRQQLQRNSIRMDRIKSKPNSYLNKSFYAKSIRSHNNLSLSRTRIQTQQIFKLSFT